MENKKKEKGEFIKIRGGAEHNLKHIDLKIPRNKFVVLTGLSGSGKSSLAFDTIYAEGQRRYMESLSSYARQFLGQMEKPNVESIEGLSPAISIDQKSTNRNPRSTVGTVTEIYDYFRLLYARIGIPHCPKCGKEIKKQSVDQMVDTIMELPESTKIQLLAPVVRGKKGRHEKVLEQAKKAGYVRVLVDGNLYELSEEITLDKNIKHNIEIVVDRLVVREGIEKRLTDSIENVLNLAEGLMIVDVIGGEPMNFSMSFACPDCGISISEIEPRSFSFNNPFGACPVCAGLGYKMEFSPELMIPDGRLSINEGAISCMGWQSSCEKTSYSHAILDAMARDFGFSLDTPFDDLSDDAKDLIINGTRGHVMKVAYKGQRGEGVYDVAFEGLIKNMERRYRETGSEMIKAEYEEYMNITPCHECKGQRLKAESLAVTVCDKNIYEITSMSVRDLKVYLENMNLSERQQFIGSQVLKEIKARVGFLSDVGLEYLTLTRATGSLSGGEAQRIRLATQIGSGLVGVTYILDEPSIGLHQRDNDKLLATLKHLRDLGNSLIVVEHDEDTMFAADHIVDIGPGAGEHGGEVIAEGTAKEIMKNPKSITGAYLSGKMKVPVPKERRKPTGYLKVIGAKQNNLKDIDVDIPLGVMTCVTGVSGSGKSSLVNEILYKTLARKLNRAKTISGEHKEIQGIEQLDKVIDINLSAMLVGDFTDGLNILQAENNRLFAEVYSESKEDIEKQLEVSVNMCKAYFEGDSVGYNVYDKEGWKIADHDNFVGEQGDAITSYIADDGCGNLIERLGEYNSIEHCLEDNFPAEMPGVRDFSDGASHFFLMDNDVIMNIKHMNDPDMVHPYFSDDCAGSYIRGNCLLSECMESETYHEIKDRLGAFLADHMHVENATYCGDPVKIVSFPGIIDVTCRFTQEEFAELDPAKVLDGKFHNRYDLNLRETLECIEKNGIKINDILAYEYIDEDAGGRSGIATLEDKRLKDFYGDRLTNIDNQEIGVYLHEAVEKHVGYFDNDTFMYTFYDTAGRGGDCEVSYNGIEEVKASIADAKCYLGQHDDIDECLEANKNVLNRMEKSKGRGGNAR